MTCLKHLSLSCKYSSRRYIFFHNWNVPNHIWCFIKIYNTMLKNSRQPNYKMRWKIAQNVHPLNEQVEEGKLSCGAE